jgi:hypothetical protein
LRHFASPDFWVCYRKLPVAIQEIADKNFSLLKNDLRHPSLHFKKVGNYCSVRVGLNYRTLGIEVADGVLWFWIGNHSEYDKIIA